MDLNTYNRQQYLNAEGTHIVPDILATALPIQEAIRQMVESNIKTDSIKQLELGFGSRLDRYKHIANKTNRHWQVTLSDFDVTVLPKPTDLFDNQYVHFDLLKYDLLTDEFPNDIFDVVLSSYVFDSIDFPDDKFEVGKHFPGGLINFVAQNLRKLNKGGLFVTMDKYSQERVEDITPAGKALYKTLDLDKAKEELLAKGYQCELVTLNDFLETYNQPIPINLNDHAVLMVTND